MTEEQRADIVLRTLNKIYPKTPIPLKHRNIFTLLVSVLLSAQCTDVTLTMLLKIYIQNIISLNTLLNWEEKKLKN